MKNHLLNLTATLSCHQIRPLSSPSVILFQLSLTWYSFHLFLPFNFVCPILIQNYMTRRFRLNCFIFPSVFFCPVPYMTHLYFVIFHFDNVKSQRNIWFFMVCFKIPFIESRCHIFFSPNNIVHLIISLSIIIVYCVLVCIAKRSQPGFTNITTSFGQW